MWVIKKISTQFSYLVRELRPSGALKKTKACGENGKKDWMSLTKR